MLLLTGQQAQVSRNHEEVLEQYLETRSDMQILSSCIQDDCVPGLSGGVDMDKLSGGVDMDRLSSGVDMGKTRIEASHQFADSPVKLEKAKRKRKSAQGSESAKRHSVSQSKVDLFIYLRLALRREIVRFVSLY